jgi:cytochrome oxidase assembly protein ShyY1
MIRRLPVIPTVVVLAAVLAMVWLGFWQIRRAHEKEALLARYAAAQSLPPIAFPTAPTKDDDLPLFRQAKGLCMKVQGLRTSAGRNRADEPGFLLIADCSTGAEGPGMSGELGWTKDPKAQPKWGGGEVRGVIVPDNRSRMRLKSATGLGGLEAGAPPSLESIPNNHRSYAAQWFLFAGIASLFYGLAVRKKLKP